MVTTNKTLVYSSLTTSIFLIFFYLCIVQNVWAASEYVPLVGLPGLPTTGGRSLVDYINAIYYITIGVGALIGVMRLAWAGVKYSLSDIVTHKEEAKHDIQGVLLGLAILLIPFIVLNTINPELTRLDVLHNAKKVSLDTSSSISNLNTGASAPVEVSALMTSCAGGVTRVGSNSYCCATDGYTGSNKCGDTTVLVSNDNVLGLDTSKVFTSQQALQDLLPANADIIQNSTNPTKDCTDWGIARDVTGVPVTFQVSQNKGGTQIQQPTNVVVCAVQ